jgi:hypothetical protein
MGGGSDSTGSDSRGTRGLPAGWLASMEVEVEVVRPGKWVSMLCMFALQRCTLASGLFEVTY